MADWKEVITHLAANVETHMDELRYRLHYQLGGVGPIKILTYRGYGSPERLYMHGRVLEDKHIPDAEKNDKVWENLLNMYKRLESDEVPHAKLIARFGDIEQEIQADEEGFFDVWIEPPKGQKLPLVENRLWHPIEVELVEPIPAAQSRYPIKATGEVLVPPPNARYVVISDIDDTVVRTDAAHMLNMARIVFLGNAHTRLPFPGVAALYRAFFSGKSGSEMNPLFYVSSSPWNLYDLLSQFFHLQDIPIGPVLFLRDWGLTEEELFPIGNKVYKTSVIRQILDFYPHLPFILIGDSGQEDPEIYTDLVNAYPHRIQAVYIRNVSRDLKRPEAIRQLAKRVLEAGSALVLADDTVALVKHAIEHDLISPDAIPDIREEKRKDEAPATPLEKVLGEAPAAEPAKAEGPTVKMTKKDVKDGNITETIKEAGDEKTQKAPTVVVEGKKNK